METISFAYDYVATTEDDLDVNVSQNLTGEGITVDRLAEAFQGFLYAAGYTTATVAIDL